MAEQFLESLLTCGRENQVRALPQSPVRVMRPAFPVSAPSPVGVRMAQPVAVRAPQPVVARAMPSMRATSPTAALSGLVPPGAKVHKVGLIGNPMNPAHVFEIEEPGSSPSAHPAQQAKA